MLPGAFSAYRFSALNNGCGKEGPLQKYYLGDETYRDENVHQDLFTANMYLAEDRILCWELVAKRSEQWVLKYVKAATGETDVPGKSLIRTILKEYDH